MIYINFTQISYANITFVPSNQTLNLANITSLSVGQQGSLLNGTISVSSIQTTYMPPNVKNIHLLSKTNWTATTYINISSTYEQPLFIGTAFFKALNLNPSNISVYQWITTKISSNVILLTHSTSTQVSTQNGTMTIYTRKQITVPIVQVGGYWQPLDYNDTIIAPGNNRFKIMGRGKPDTTYNWAFEFSTANLVKPTPIISNIIIGNSIITPQSVLNYNSTGKSDLPITTINIDPLWIVPSGVANVINVTVKNIDPSNVIATNSVLLIPVNALNYTSVLDGGVNNIVVFNGITGNIEDSWLAGNAANEISTTFNTASQVNIYVKISSPIAASTNAVNVISIGTYPISTLGFSSETGEAPQLTGSVGSTTWGTYDIGANVFYIYDNFSCFGRTCKLNSNTWNTAATYNSGNEKYTVNNGLFITETAASASDLGLITLKSIGTSNGIVDALFGNYIRTGGTPSIGDGVTSSHTPVGSSQAGFVNAYSMFQIGPSSMDLRLVQSSGSTTLATFSPSISPNETLTNWTYVGKEVGILGTFKASGSDSTLSSGLTTWGEISEAGGAQAAGATFYWYAVRNNSYIGTPVTYFGPVQYTKITPSCINNWQGGACVGNIIYTQNTILTADVNASGSVLINANNAITSNGFNFYVGGQFTLNGIINVGLRSPGGQTQDAMGANKVNSYSGSGGGGGGGNNNGACIGSPGGGAGGNTIAVGGAGGTTPVGFGGHGDPGGAGTTPIAPTITNTLIQTWFTGNDFQDYLSGAGGGASDENYNNACGGSGSFGIGGYGSNGIYIQALNINIANGTVNTIATSGASASNGGGGGGGGGGSVLLAYGSIVNVGSGVSSAGGSGGTGSGGAGNGGAGGNGQTITYQYTIPPIPTTP